MLRIFFGIVLIIGGVVAALAVLGQVISIGRVGVHSAYEAGYTAGRIFVVIVAAAICFFCFKYGIRLVKKRS